MNKYRIELFIEVEAESSEDALNFAEDAINSYPKAPLSLEASYMIEEV